MAEVRVYYVGRKQVKKDTITGSGVEWYGYGDSRVVPETVGQKLIKFNDVWVTEKVWEDQYADDSAETEADTKSNPEDSESVGLSDIPIVSEPPKSETTEEPKDLKVLVQEAIRKLDRTDKDQFTGNGAPKIAAVRKLLPADTQLDAQTLNAAFDEIKGEFR